MSVDLLILKINSLMPLRIYTVVRGLYTGSAYTELINYPLRDLIIIFGKHTGIDCKLYMAVA